MPLAGTGAPGATGPTYDYSAVGRLTKRTWLRPGTGGARVTTTYSYGVDDTVSQTRHGDLVKISFYDSLGQVISGKKYLGGVRLELGPGGEKFGGWRSPGLSSSLAATLGVP